MGFAKALVIVMSLAILAGLGLLVYGIATRSAKMSEGVKDMGTVELAIPPGSRLRDLDVQGGRLYLVLEDPDGKIGILVLDEATGRVIGDIRLLPGTATR